MCNNNNNIWTYPQGSGNSIFVVVFDKFLNILYKVY